MAHRATTIVRPVPQQPRRHSPWVDRLLLALALSVVTALLASIALAVVNRLPSSAPAQQPVQTQVDVPAVPAAPAVVDVPNPIQNTVDTQNPLTQNTQKDVLPTRSMPSLTEQLDWKFLEISAHFSTPLFLKEFSVWFRAEDGSIRPIAEFTGSSMSDENRLGMSADGVVIVHDGRQVSIDGAKHWVDIPSFPSALENEPNAWGWSIMGALREGNTVVLYGTYNYFPEKESTPGVMNSNKWYQTKIPVATFEELSR